MIAEMIADCGRAQSHDVELVERPVRCACRRVGGGEDRGQDREVLGDVVGDRERGQRAAGDQQLLADLDDLDQLRRVRVEVDHVARLARGLGAGVHRHADVRLGERRGVVGAVAGHRDQAAVGLLLLDQLELASGVASARKSSTPGLLGDLGGRQRLSPVIMTVRMPIARSWSKRWLIPSLIDVLEVDDAEHLAVARDGQRRAALAADAVELVLQLGRRLPALAVDPAR